MALINCIQCGANISEKAAKCPKCGNQKPFEKPFGACVECSANIPKKSDVCPECGLSNPFNAVRSERKVTPITDAIAHKNKEASNIESASFDVNYTPFLGVSNNNTFRGKGVLKIREASLDFYGTSKGSISKVWGKNYITIYLHDILDITIKNRQLRLFYSNDNMAKDTFIFYANSLEEAQKMFALLPKQKEFNHNKSIYLIRFYDSLTTTKSIITFVISGGIIFFGVIKGIAFRMILMHGLLGIAGLVLIVSVIKLLLEIIFSTIKSVTESNLIKSLKCIDNQEEIMSLISFLDGYHFSNNNDKEMIRLVLNIRSKELA